MALDVKKSLDLRLFWVKNYLLAFKSVLRVVVPLVFSTVEFYFEQHPRQSYH